VTEPAPYRRTFFRLLGFLKPYKLSLIVSIVLACGSQAAAIALVWVTGGVIDKAIQPKDSSKLWTYVWTILGLGVVKAGLMVGRRLISGPPGARRRDGHAQRALRPARQAVVPLLRHAPDRASSCRGRRSTSRASAFFLGYGLIFFFQNILVSSRSPVVLFFVQWELALIALAIVPFSSCSPTGTATISHPTPPRRPAEARDVAPSRRRASSASTSSRRSPGAGRGGEVPRRSERVFEQSVKANRQRALYIPVLSFLRCSRRRRSCSSAATWW
jgi:ABC-type multidrug transport system fused ATPase/permease subunit